MLIVTGRDNMKRQTTFRKVVLKNAKRFLAHMDYTVLNQKKIIVFLYIQLNYVIIK